MKKKTPPSSGLRAQSVKLKTARGRTVSSQRWLQRQLNDPYVQRAHQEGYRSRAAFKLLEIQDKYDLLKPGMTILDLGAAPGGWSQVLVNRLAPENSTLIALDLSPMEPIAGVHIIQADFSEPEALKLLSPLTDGGVDVVLSDMAPYTIGHQQTDHLRIMALVELAYDFALSVLKPQGSFVAKVLQGGTAHEILQDMKRRFEKVSHFKPPASRKESAEMYVIAQGFRKKDI